MRRSEKAIRYRPHAEERMEDRNVSRQHVRSTLTDPSAQRPARIEGAIRFERPISSRKRLAVIALEDSTSFTVITVFWM